MAQPSAQIHTSVASILLVLLLAMLTPIGLQAAGKEKDSGIEIELLTDSDKLIPLYYQHGDYWCTHLKTPDILIRNHSALDINIEKIVILGMTAGREMTRITIYRDKIAGLIASRGRSLNSLLAGQDDPLNVRRLGRVYGKPVEKTPAYCDTIPIPPDNFAALSLADAAYLFYEGEAKIDGIKIALETDTSGTAHFEAELDDFRCKGEYQYPIKGSSVAASVPFGHSHRFGNCQEFAIDIMDVRRLDEGAFTTSSGFSPMVILGSADANDYHIYNREVHAMADGVVIAIASGFPDEMAANPQDFYGERIPRITPELLERGVSPENISGGNFVFIDHGNGEYARYCHLRENIPVKNGDKITCGQIIGYVGNSGNSTEPHLHLELLDSADYNTANGLPIVFGDLPLGAALDSPTMGERNSLIFSEFIFINVQ